MRSATLRGWILAAIVVAFGLVLLFVSGTALTTVDDLGTFVAAVAATLAAGRRAWLVRGRARTSWTLMTAAFGAAALGEGIWGCYELGCTRRRRSRPSPTSPT